MNLKWVKLILFLYQSPSLKMDTVTSSLQLFYTTNPLLMHDAEFCGVFLFQNLWLWWHQSRYLPSIVCLVCWTYRSEWLSLQLYGMSGVRRMATACIARLTVKDSLPLFHSYYCVALRIKEHYLVLVIYVYLPNCWYCY